MSSHNKNQPAPDSETSQDKDSTESLEERSARLEAEAAALYQQQDELAPNETADTTPDGADSERLQALENELAQAKDQMVRALAEAENTRKRAQKEREDASRFAISSFARDLLDVADNLRRALDAVPEDLIKADERVKNLIDGIEATERNLLRSFEKNGIQKLEPLEEPFDPNFHEVMFETPGTGKPAGTIVQVVETGYTLNGRLIRPARVGVAKDEGQGSAGSSQSSEPGDNLDIES